MLKIYILSILSSFFRKVTLWKTYKLFNKENIKNPQIPTYHYYILKFLLKMWKTPKSSMNTCFIPVVFCGLIFTNDFLY